MASSDHTRPETPPHHPIHNIHLTTPGIEKLIRRYDPSLELVSAVDLPSNRSWNNRIYFLSVRKCQDAVQPQSLVLKVNGRFFGPEKVENEVACLRLLEKYCPELPSPRALAWSTGGSSVTIVSGSRLEPSELEISHCSWILMTRVSGEPISIFEPDEEAMIDLAGQLADYVTSWRRLIPPQEECGNIRFRKNEYEQAEPAFGRTEQLYDSPFELVIRGVLGENIKMLEAMSSLQHYYRVKLGDKIGQLETSETYKPNRDLADRIRNFMENGLATLKPAQEPSPDGSNSDQFLFTHYDLSPRNVLIAGNPPTITGIVDFEFAGFFSPLEEFLNDHVNNEGDWPKPFYDAYLKQIELNGIATHRLGFDKKQWQQAIWIEQLLQNIAPWWLPGKFECDALEEELRTARKMVQGMLDHLEQACGMQ